MSAYRYYMTPARRFAARLGRSSAVADVGDRPGPQRDTAVAMLRRAPVDLSRRASYGSEQRTEHVLVTWADGRQAHLEQTRDDRISFALRDRFEAAQPTCREQLLRLLSTLGEPVSVTVAWSYEAAWEGEPPISRRGSRRFTWAEVSALLAWVPPIVLRCSVVWR